MSVTHSWQTIRRRGDTATRLRTKLGERAFSFCDPAEWDSLPSELQMIADTNSFKKKLKAHFHNQAFCVD